MRSGRADRGAGASSPEQAVVASAPSIGRGIASLQPEDLGTGTLVLPLSLSLWLRRADADLTSARAAMLALRRALLEAAGMDVASEPVPLLAGDDRTVVLSLAVYLAGLVHRAAVVTGRSRDAVVEEALCLVERHVAAREVG